MASAKIATLAIRTLAKPIATQIKQQAQHHHRFRAVCISLAQFMHRTEMIMRTNLLTPSRPPSSHGASSKDGKDGKDGAEDGSHSSGKPRIRPLNEAKAVANGANALAEGFLFCLAAALILGESYRGSRSRAKQRDRTESGLEELRLITRTLADRIGVDWVEVERHAREAEEAVETEEPDQKERAKDAKCTEQSSSGDADTTDTGAATSTAPSGSAVSPILTRAEAIRREREALLRDRDRLQHAVDVLLRLAIKSKWIAGPEAMHLQSILDGTDEHTGRKAHEQTPNVPSSHSDSEPSTGAGARQESAAQITNLMLQEPSSLSPSILDRVTQLRAQRQGDSGPKSQ